MVGLTLLQILSEAPHCSLEFGSFGMHHVTHIIIQFELLFFAPAWQSIAMRQNSKVSIIDLGSNGCNCSTPGQSPVQSIFRWYWWLCVSARCLGPPKCACRP